MNFTQFFTLTAFSTLTLLVGQVSRWWARGEIGDGWHGLGAASGQVVIV